MEATVGSSSAQAWRQRPVGESLWPGLPWRTRSRKTGREASGRSAGSSSWLLASHSSASAGQPDSDEVSLSALLDASNRQSRERLPSDGSERSLLCDTERRSSCGHASTRPCREASVLNARFTSRMCHDFSRQATPRNEEGSSRNCRLLWSATWDSPLLLLAGGGILLRHAERGDFADIGDGLVLPITSYRATAGHEVGRRKKPCDAKRAESERKNPAGARKATIIGSCKQQSLVRA